MTNVQFVRWASEPVESTFVSRDGLGGPSYGSGQNLTRTREPESETMRQGLQSQHFVMKFSLAQPLLARDNADVVSR